MSFVDDYSRKLWIFILKTKDEALENFKKWKVLIEKQTGRSVRRLRIDNRLEFCSREFENFYKQEGIARHKTTAGTP